MNATVNHEAGKARAYDHLVGKRFTVHDIERFMQGYIEAFYFADTGEEESGQPPSDAELSTEAKDHIERECLAYLIVAEADIAHAVDTFPYDMTQAGRDFYLTRCGHGVGFWDRPELEEYGDILTAHAKKFDSPDLYLGDDGLIYQS